MMKILYLYLCLTLAAASHPSLSSDEYFQLVIPVEPCGGWNSTCNRGLPQDRIQEEATCEIAVGDVVTVEGECVACFNSSLAYYRLEVGTQFGTIPVSEATLGAVVEGERYAFGMTIRLSSALAGQTIIIRQIISDQNAAGEILCCAQITCRLY